jgi:hypothetical protein
VFEELEPVLRAEFVRRLADNPNLPRNLAVRLAQDEIIVARSVLARSLALDDGSLERLVRSQSQAHLLAIATRARLSEMVTSALVECGDDEVVGTVVSNGGAHFSAETLSVLAQRAKTNPALCERLATRDDLPEAIMAAIVSLVGKAVEAKLATPDPDADRRVRLAFGSGGHLTGVAADADDQPKSRPLDVLIDQMEQGLLALDEAIIELADADEAAAIGKLLERRIELQPHTLVRAIFAECEEPITLFCRAAGMHLNGFSAVLRMRRRRRGGDNRPSEALAAFLGVPQATAVLIVRYLRGRGRALAT